MSETLTFTIDEVTPQRDAVYANQGIPVGAEVDERVAALYDKALDLFDHAACGIGVLSDISKPEFRNIYDGEGRNEPETPVGDIFDRADTLALFAVTLGERIGKRIEGLFRSNDYALGSMLDSVASVAADRTAEIAQRRFREKLVTGASRASALAVLRYSPGYCGWHISGQRKLFEFLQPQRIGIRLRESFLMEPLKSVSGVMIAGLREIHGFPPTYSFCSQCRTQGCRERIRALHTG